MRQAELDRVVKNLNDRVVRIEQILPTLATKEDLLLTKQEVHAAIREEGDRTRQHFNAVAERLETHINVIAEGHVALHERLTAFRAEVKADLAGIDRRLMRLEASR